ncbi:MAG: hypothetical protein RLZZ141_1591, partial [Pseudomonadota bacterium]
MGPTVTRLGVEIPVVVGNMV